MANQVYYDCLFLRLYTFYMTLFYIVYSKFHLRSNFFSFDFYCTRFFVPQNFAIRFIGSNKSMEMKREKITESQIHNHFKMKIKIKNYNNFNDMGMIRMNRLFGTRSVFREEILIIK